MIQGQTIDWKKVSALTPEQFPDFMRSLAPQFVEFVRAYYEWMGLPGNPDHALANLRNYRDVDRTVDEYLDFFHDEYLERLPKNLATDRRNLVKYITQFYRTAGNKKSVRFLFRIMFDEEIDFYIPGKDILRLSDGKWQIDRSLKVRLVDPTFDLGQVVFNEVVGSISGARTRIESVTTTLVNRATVVELFVAKVIGDFIANEPLTLGGEIFASVDSHGLYTYPGRYISSDGWLSSDKKFQDNYFYQEYSYVIKAGRALSTYAHLLKGLTHPAGTKLFGQIQLVHSLNLSVPTVESHFTLAPASDSIVNLAPSGITGITSGEAAGVAGRIGIDLEIDDTDLDAATGVIEILGINLAAVQVIRTNTISGLSGIAIGDMAGWPISLLPSGRCVIGASAHFLSDLVPNQSILWTDLDSVYSQTHNEIETVSSNHGLVLKFVAPVAITHPAITV